MTRSAARRGFTLIELVVTSVVFLIISGVGVAAVARMIDTVDEARAKSVIDQVLIAQTTFAGEFDQYASYPDDLRDLDRSITVVAATQVSTDPTTASIAVGDSGSLVVVVAHQRGCAAVRVAPLTSGGTRTTVVVPAANGCFAAAGLAAGDPPITAVQLRR